MNFTPVAILHIIGDINSTTPPVMYDYFNFTFKTTFLSNSQRSGHRNRARF